MRPKMSRIRGSAESTCVDNCHLREHRLPCKIHWSSEANPRECVFNYLFTTKYFKNNFDYSKIKIGQENIYN